MLNLTKDQINIRWDSLAQPLRDAIFSEENNALIDSIAEEYILLIGQTRNLAMIVADVIFGFISVADAEKQIKEELGLEPEEANNILQRVSEKIFAPLKSEIDKIYSPASVLQANAIVGGGQRVNPAILGTGASEFAKPISLENVSQSSAVASKAEMPAAPFVLHKEEEMRPVLGEKKSLGGLFGFLGKETSREISRPAVAVQVDFGGIPKPPISQAEKISTRKSEPEKIIHYGETIGGGGIPAATAMPSTAFPSVSVNSGVKQIDYSEKAVVPVPTPIVPQNLVTPIQINPLIPSEMPEIKKPVMPPVVSSISPISPTLVEKPKEPVPVAPISVASLAASPLSAVITEKKEMQISIPVPTPPIPPTVSASAPVVREESVSKEQAGDDIIDLRTFQIGK